MRLLLPLLLSAFAAAAQLLSSTPVPARFDCAIDGDVVDRVTHEPVPRAKIALVWPGGNRSGAADNSGRWSFSGIACAGVAVSASRFGYLNSGNIGSPPLNFLLSPDTPSHVDIELTPQATLTGKVVDENGDPVPGLRVVSYIARVVEGRRQLANAPQTVTNDIGQFRIAPLEPGRYTVCAEPAMGQTDYEEACYPASLEAGSVAAMRLAPGQENEINFALTRTSPVRVSGTLIGVSSGTRTTVLLSRAGGLRMQPAMAAGVSADGRFAFPAVPPGSWILIAQQETPDSDRLAARMPVEVGASDVSDLVLTLEPTITITGTVRTDSQSAPAETAPGIRLSLQPTERNSGVLNIVFSDDDRSFTITGVTPGTYRMNVGAASYFVKSALLGGRDIVHGEFIINAAPGPMEIVLSDTGGSLEGDVTMDDASPAASASIVLLREGEFMRVVPVTNGHFNLRNLQPGAYTVSAWDGIRNVEYANTEWMRQYGGASAAVTIEAGQDARIKLTRQTAPLE
jgi:hypothetical protein